MNKTNLIIICCLFGVFTLLTTFALIHSHQRGYDAGYNSGSDTAIAFFRKYPDHHVVVTKNEADLTRHYKIYTDTTCTNLIYTFVENIEPKDCLSY